MTREQNLDKKIDTKTMKTQARINKKNSDSKKTKKRLQQKHTPINDFDTKIKRGIYPNFSKGKNWIEKPGKSRIRL